MVASLDALGVEYGTDKNSRCHDYLRIYDELFGPLRHQPINLLELGVAFGQSIRMWADYFDHPETVIYGIDDGSYAAFRDAQPVNAVLFAADQAEIPVGWPAPLLDIVVDDASHDPVKTEASFRLWYPRVRPGGVYVVEDISNVDIRFLQGLVSDAANRVGDFGIDWMRFSHDLCIIHKLWGVVFPSGSCPGAVMTANPGLEKHLWIGAV